MVAFYPRKQTFIISIVCIAAVGATAYYVYGGMPWRQGAEKAGIVSVLPEVDNAPVTGTKEDWRRQFFDSSATGTLKTAYIAGGSSAGAGSGTDAPLSATDFLGREFMSRYAELSQAGLVGDEKTVTNAANRVIENGMSNIDFPEPYSSKNIRITADQSSNSLSSYGKNVLLIVKSYVPDQNHNEAVVAADSFDQEDMGMLKDIDPIIAGYRAAVSALANMTVPQPLVSYHLKLIDGFNLALWDAQALRHSDTDPFKGMAALSSVIPALQTMNDAVKGIVSYINNAGVYFK